MLQSIISKLGACAVVLVCVYAIVAGSWRERFAGLIYLTAYIISLGLGLTSRSFPIYHMLLVDALCLAGLFMTNWKPVHPWPKWAFTAQLISVAADIFALIDYGLPRWFFLVVQIVTGYAVLLAVLIGTINHRIRRRDAKTVTRSPTFVAPSRRPDQ